MAKITADTLISEVLELNPDAPEILLSAGMHCFARTGRRSPRRSPSTAKTLTPCSKSSTQASTESPAREGDPRRFFCGDFHNIFILI